MAVIEVLPPGELFACEFITSAGVLDGDEAAANGRDNFRFPACHPAFDARRRQVVEGQFAPVGSDDGGALHIVAEHGELPLMVSILQTIGEAI
jgi:hypothetical protein